MDEIFLMPHQVERVLADIPLSRRNASSASLISCAQEANILLDRCPEQSLRRTVAFDSHVDVHVFSSYSQCENKPPSPPPNSLPRQIKAGRNSAEFASSWGNCLMSAVCPSCLIPVSTSSKVAPTEGCASREVCDNGKWNWRGEPPFCCVCAKERGLGSFSSLACKTCTAFRKTVYVRKGFSSKVCRNCGMKKEDHSKKGKFLCCRK
jgi:hypothetical protein